MRNEPKSIQLHKFGDDPLSQLPRVMQPTYLCEYLATLGARTVIEEQNYFDRDYLAEFSSFYSTSSAGYPNVCQRLHFFSSDKIDRETIKCFLSEEEAAFNELQDNYLGFTILRPLPVTVLGRTVLRWFPDNFPETPRIIEPSREYVCHLAGIALKISDGLAWQQQDSAVGACATIGIWTILHSSAFDDHHAIPTTAAITRSAHKTASLGARVFPSKGLTHYQVCEAIKEQNLSPCVIDGNLIDGHETYFDKERFSSSCAAFIRSGYPVLIGGLIPNEGLHANVAVGFRSAYPGEIKAGEYGIQDSNVNYIYIHDDNIGPSVRFKIEEDRNGRVFLKADSPASVRDVENGGSITDNYCKIYPQRMIVAVHNELRISPDELHRIALQFSSDLSGIIKEIGKYYKSPVSGVSTSTRFFKLKDYLGKHLSGLLSSNPGLLSKVRLDLAENVNPMSLHIGVIRVGLQNSTPLMDIVLDTTDSDANHPIYCHICFASAVPQLAAAVASRLEINLGTCVEAY